VIVTRQTPFYPGGNVRNGAMLPHADVIDPDGTGFKVVSDYEMIALRCNTLATAPSEKPTGRLTPAEARHLAARLLEAADAVDRDYPPAQYPRT